MRGRSKPLHAAVGAIAIMTMLAGCNSSARPGPSRSQIGTPAHPSDLRSSPDPSNEPDPPSGAASPGVEDSWQIVGLGDSFTSTQNSHGRTYLDLFASSLAESTGRRVTVADLSDDANTTARVAELLRTDASTRASVASADMVLISVGGNDSDPFGVYPHGTCSPRQPLPTCLEIYAPTFAANYEVILSNIEQLRSGHPTAIRVTSADNPFVGWSEAPSPTFGVDFYAQVAEAESKTACNIATSHGGLCVDYLHIFGGPEGTTDPARFLGPDHAHPGDLGIRAIAAELVRLGVPEVR